MQISTFWQGNFFQILIEKLVLASLFTAKMWGRGGKMSSFYSLADSATVKILKARFQSRPTPIGHVNVLLKVSEIVCQNHGHCTPLFKVYLDHPHQVIQVSIDYPLWFY